MLRIVNNINILKVSCEIISNYSTSYNPAILPVIKTHRKPRWVPIAKSKLFRVPERPKIPEDELKEILRLHNNYRNNIKSLKIYFVQKYSTEYQASLDPEEILKHFKEDFEKCSEINDKWNEQVKATREKRLADALDEAIDLARQKINMEQKKQEEIEQLAEEIVKQQKEASAGFITPENIDEAIDKALVETVDYNFAIDINGEKILGRETKLVVEKDKINVKQ